MKVNKKHRKPRMASKTNHNYDAIKNVCKTKIVSVCNETTNMFVKNI